MFSAKIQFAQKIQCGTSVMWKQASSESVEYLQQQQKGILT